ncbi:MAG TPA: ABC transporter substrate-binding protein [Vicinamibacterales bacterium]|nr:ABC transporter substrate-binding protein [Vicinamibacterales bacterium]
MSIRLKQFGALGVLLAAVAVVGVPKAIRYTHAPDAARRGRASSTLVASIRAEPRSFNRYTARDLSTAVLTFLMHDGLVRVNRVTNQLEPELAERWELLPDGRTYRLQLRPNVQFSDGAPFTSADVVFSFKAIYDTAVGSVLADTLQVRGKPLKVTADGALTVTIQFAFPFGPGLRMLDGVPIYPRHRLEAALAAGAFRSAWGPATAPSDLAGLGPFVLRSYAPGQRLTFDRNPRFWRSAAAPSVDHAVVTVVPDQDAELLQLETGEIDLTQSELRPADVPALKAAAGAGRVTVTDAGIGLDGDLLWINLLPAKAGDTRASWLRHADFRRAVAHSVDRRAFVDTVYFGEAVPADSIISPGNRDWHVTAPPPDYDPASASRLLAGLGLSERDASGVLHDHSGRPARLSLLTQKGNTSLERGAAVVRDSLLAVGVQVDVVAMEAGALVDRVMRGDYDAAYFSLLTTDTDPALNLDFWLSSGGAHVWHPEQRVAATPWEAEIDALMDKVATTLDPEGRRIQFATVQQIMAREVPALCFAFPRHRIAVNARVADAAPSPFRPPLLWNPAAIRLRSAP